MKIESTDNLIKSVALCISLEKIPARPLSIGLLLQQELQ